ncbi:MAG: hypothetical protein M1825_004399 [Sarcosagium campestre]|nr:MAG: hypothetical protein M1825_004399 [Sarcosagium campestre]
MAYLAPIHRPSSVRHALKLCFFRPDDDCLVVAKANILEFHSQSDNGLSLQHSRTVYGKIVMLQRLRSLPGSTDHLFVGTDKKLYFTVSWDPTKSELRTERSFRHHASGGARDSQFEPGCHMDPEERLLSLSLFEGIITVIPILRPKQGGKKAAAPLNVGDPIPARIPELFIRSATFLYGSKKPRYAILWEDGHKRVHLRTKEISFTAGSSSEPGTAEFIDTSFVLANLQDQGASHLIPIPTPVGGLVVLGESSILYVKENGKEQKTLNLADATIFVCWERIDSNQFVLADDYGRMYLLSLMLDGSSVKDLRIVLLGQTSRASVLVPLARGCIFVGSHQGDSQVIQLDLASRAVQLVQTISNIAPILDFTIMDLGNRAGEGKANEYSSGQARLVTGSGAFQDGSLRSVRSGVGLEDQGILGEMDGVRDLFSLSPHGTEGQVDTLVVSLINETRILHFSADGDVEELEDYKGLILNERTLVVSNISDDRMIQVTGSRVSLIDAEGGTLLSDWSPSAGKSITSASANEDKVLLSIGGTTLVVLDAQAELAVLAERDFGDDSQIACVTMPSPSSSVCFVGFWQSAAISILRTDDLQTLRNEVVGDVNGGSIPRQILLVQVLADRPPTLFISLADGLVTAFSFDSRDNALSSKNSIVLGTQQANLRALSRGKGLFNVFATCDHPSLIYGSEGRLVFSGVTADDAIMVCEFDSGPFPGAIMIATSTELKIAVVDQERKTHVRSLHLGETARRITYSKSLKSFGVGTIERQLQDGTEIAKSHIKLVDEVLFDALDTYELEEGELIESMMRAEIDDGFGQYVERFVVGTGFLEDDETRSPRGRILVFAVDEERKLILMAEAAVKGACRCLDSLDGKIVAALVKTVEIFSLEFDSAVPSLKRRARYRTSTAPVNLAVMGKLIAVADIMKSVALVEYSVGETGLPDTLTEVARHYHTAWSTAVAHVAEDTLLECDAEGNLTVLYRDRNGVTEDDRKRLTVTGEMRLGEMVNRIRRIDISVSSGAVVIPRAFLATVDGSIYLFALIAPGKQDVLMRLQASLANHVQSPGQIPFNGYRAFSNGVREDDEPFRFVDGELIERFLECSDSLQEDIVEGLSMDVEAVRSMVESLRRLR